MIKAVTNILSTVGLHGLYCAVKGKALNSTSLFEVKRHDIKFPISLRIPSSDVSTYRQVFINQEYDFREETHPKVIVDAGANIGLASIYFANKYPKAKLIAIEPEEGNFELLKKNVAPYITIIPVQAALWSHNGEIDLVDPERGNWGFMTEEGNASENQLREVCHKVRAMTVDKIIDDYDLDKIDILKIDIEGAEKEVFSDTSSWIERVDALIIELHEFIKHGCNRSFYNGSNGFDSEWQQGENVYLSRGTYLTRRCT
ncbi:MAG: FkbM family methyltransferase [Planctomycetes bacterium]|nr:FkbM family methyltransferase [Planctomycetota bacterium]